METLLSLSSVCFQSSGMCCASIDGRRKEKLDEGHSEAFITFKWELKIHFKTCHSVFRVCAMFKFVSAISSLS